MKFEQLASLGAAGAAGGMAAVYLFMVFGTRHVAGGGMDVIGWTIFTIAAAIPAAVFIGVHLALAQQLKSGPQTLRP